MRFIDTMQDRYYAEAKQGFMAALDGWEGGDERLLRDIEDGTLIRGNFVTHRGRCPIASIAGANTAYDANGIDWDPHARFYMAWDRPRRSVLPWRRLTARTLRRWVEEWREMKRKLERDAAIERVLTEARELEAETARARWQDVGAVVVDH